MIPQALLSQAEVNELLGTYPLGACWNASHYLGSMFVLDFGDRLLVNRARGSVFVGTASISVRDVFWSLSRQGQRLATADEIDHTRFGDVLLPALVGTSLESIESLAERKAKAFHFSGNVDLVVDTSDIWKSNDVLVEVTLPSGKHLRLMPGGLWTSSGDRDLVRKQSFERRS